MAEQQTTEKTYKSVLTGESTSLSDHKRFEDENRENEFPPEKFMIKTSVSEVVSLQFEIESKVNYPTFISAVCYPARPTISANLPQEWAGKNLIFLKIFRSKDQGGPVIKEIGSNVKYFRLFLTTDLLLRIISSIPSLSAAFNKSYRRLGSKDKGRTMVESVIHLESDESDNHTVRMYGTSEKDKMVKYYHQISPEKYTMFILSMEALDVLSRKKFDILNFNKKCSDVKKLRI